MTDSDDERTTIRTGREIEQEYRFDASEAGAFLVGLGGQPQADGGLTLSGRTDEEAPSVE